jgi:hypothetical protein
MFHVRSFTQVEAKLLPENAKTLKFINLSRPSTAYGMTAIPLRDGTR